MHIWHTRIQMRRPRAAFQFTFVAKVLDKTGKTIDSAVLDWAQSWWESHEDAEEARQKLAPSGVMYVLWDAVTKEIVRNDDHGRVELARIEMTIGADTLVFEPDGTEDDL